MKRPKSPKSRISPRIALGNEADAPPAGAVTLTLSHEGSGIAINEVGEDGMAVVELAPYGRKGHAQRGPTGAVVRRMQVFTREDAVAMAHEFNARMRTRLGFGAPWYIGHPDDPDFRSFYTDARAYGRIKRLEAGPRAILAHVKFSPAGLDLIRSEAFEGHSPRWDAAETAPGEWHPVRLISAGFTNQPNLPVPAITAANEEASDNQDTTTTTKNDTMNLQRIRESLIGCGRLKPGAADDEVEGAILAMANELTAQRGELETALANAKSLTEERDGLAERIDTLSNEIAELRDSSAKLSNELAGLLVDEEIRAGRVLTGKRAEAIARLTDAATPAERRTVAALANEFGPGQPMKRDSQTGDRLQERRGDEADRSAQRIALANELAPKGADGKPDFDRGWQLAKARRPELFAPAMSEG